MSYLEIYRRWLEIDLKHNKDAIIDADRFVTKLHVFEVISDSEMQTVNAETTTENKNRLFMEILPSKGKTGLEKMIEIMTNNTDDVLLEYIKEARGIKIVPNKIWGDIPKKNLCFINRQSATENVQLVFSKNLDNNCSYSSSVVIWGLGGVGKTQTAAQFVYENENKYQTLFWIKSESVKEEFIQIGEDYKLNVKDKEECVFIKKMKTWFGQSCAPCLLVFDNAETIEQIDNYLPPKGCNILITSRNNNNWLSNQVDSCFELGVFSDEEARLYIRNILAQKMKAMDGADLSKLASMLGHLPLALSHACSHINKRCWQISYYIKELEEQLKLSTTLQNSSVLPTVFATWRITQAEIKEKSHVADRLLSICAYLQPDAIPTFLFKYAVGKMNEEEGEVLKAMRILIDFSMLVLNEKQEHVSIHCLLQAAIRYEQQLEGNIRLEEVATCLVGAYPKERTKIDLNHKRQLLPHLSKVTKNILVWVKSRLNVKLQIVLFMQLLDNNANAFLEMGMGLEAKNLLEILLAITTAQFHSDHPLVAATLTNLGTAYGSLGGNKKKKELLERALVIQEERFGPNHPAVAITLGNLGNAYGSLGDNKKKKEFLERALVIKEEHFGPNHPAVAITLGNLGNAYGSLGDYKKKKELLERALVIQEEHFGPNHPEVAITLTNLGTTYGSLGDNKKEKEFLERALVIKEEHFDPNHPEVAATLTNLGTACGSLGDNKNMKEFLEWALVIQEEHFGLNHPEVAITLGNLGTAYDSLGDNKKEKKFLEKALVIQENILHEIIQKWQ